MPCGAGRSELFWQGPKGEAMRRNPALYVVSVAALVGAILGCEKTARRPSFPALDDTEPAWKASDIKLPWRPASQRFDFAARVTLPPVEAGKAPEPARLILNAQDKSNYNWVEITTAKVRFGKTEADWETEIAAVPVDIAADRPHTVKVKRRDAEILVAVDGKVVVTAFDETFGAGDVGAAARSRKVVFNKLSPPQEIGREIALSDDFMRTQKEAGPWRVMTGDWELLSLDHASMSANAFFYNGKGERALALAGNRFWDHYFVAASCRGPASGRMGIVAAHTGDSYLLFRWGAKGTAPAASGSDSAEGLSELVYVSGRDETILASSVGGYVPGQWYRIRLVLGTGTATAYVDDHKILSVDDPRLFEGRIALWADSTDAVSFDDVLVGQRHEFASDFTAAGAIGSWQRAGGEWSVADGMVQCKAAGGDAALLGGAKDWWRYRFEAEVRPGGADVSGIALNYLSYTDNLKLVLREPGEKSKGDPSLQLVRVTGSDEKVLDSVVVPRANSYRLAAFSDRGYVAGLLDGKVVVEGWDDNCRAGRVGFVVVGGDAAFGAARMKHLPTSEPLLSTNAIFSQERSMSNWSSSQGDWRIGRNAVMGVHPRWHRALLPGDVTLSLPIEKEKDDVAQMGLSIAKSGEQGTKNNGYVLKADLDRRSAFFEGKQKPGTDGSLVLKLYRQGDVVKEATLQAPKPLRSVDLRRAGRFVVAYVNGSQSLVFRDEEPINDSKVAWFGRGVFIPDDGVEVYSTAVRNYTFGRAPVDWRVASGLWKVTNRWQCDPRWSFFSGTVDGHRGSSGRENKLALIWNKRRFPGDVTVEFYCGPMMSRERGNRYEYARDFNISIGADGQDPASGYTCMFGGFNDTRSVIARQGKIVRVGGQVIPRQGSIHRRWFYVRVERRGNKIQFNVDDNLVNLTFDDKDPLKGDQLGIWTYDCGMMVSRIRISSASGEVFEMPGTAGTESPKTIYDKEKK